MRKGDWKLVYFAEGHPPLLFNMSDDPHELNNLADVCSDVCRELTQNLEEILDPEAVNQQAFADQQIMIEKLGGLEKIWQMQSFNHTPLE